MTAGITVPISIFGAFGVMYLLGYSLDVLSLMALTIATGFAVDDAIIDENGGGPGVRLRKRPQKRS